MIAGIDIGSWRSSICVYEGERRLYPQYLFRTKRVPAAHAGRPRFFMWMKSGRILAGQDAWKRENRIRTDCKAA